MFFYIILIYLSPFISYKIMLFFSSQYISFGPPVGDTLWVKSRGKGHFCGLEKIHVVEDSVKLLGKTFVSQKTREGWEFQI